MENKISRQNTPRDNQVPKVANNSFTSFWKNRKFSAVTHFSQLKKSVDSPISLLPGKICRMKGKSPSFKDVVRGIVKSKAQATESGVSNWLYQRASQPQGSITVPTTAHQTVSRPSAGIATGVTIPATGTRSNQPSLLSAAEVTDMKTPSGVSQLDRKDLGKSLRFDHLQSYMRPNRNKPEFHFYTSSPADPWNYYFWYSPYLHIQDIPLSIPTNVKRSPAKPAGKPKSRYLEPSALQYVQLCSHLARRHYDKDLCDVFFHIPDPYICRKDLLSVPDEDTEFWETLRFVGIKAARDLLSKRNFEKICAEILCEAKIRNS